MIIIEQKRRYAAELHMVHQAKDGSFAVVASLFKIGTEEPFLSQVLLRSVTIDWLNLIIQCY